MMTNKKREKIMPGETITLIQKINESGVLVWLFLAFVTFLGASVRYFKSLSTDQPFRAFQWLIEIIVSAFVAIMAGLVCAGMELDYLWSFAIIGISSHEGTRALYLFRNWLRKRVDV